MIDVVKFVEAPDVFPAVTRAVSMMGNEIIRIVTAITTPIISPALKFILTFYQRRAPIITTMAIKTVTVTDRTNVKFVIARSSGVVIPDAVACVVESELRISGSAITAKIASNTTTITLNINPLDMT